MFETFGCFLRSSRFSSSDSEVSGLHPVLHPDLSTRPSPPEPLPLY